MKKNNGMAKLAIMSLLMMLSDTLFSSFSGVQAQEAHMTLATASMNLKMLRKTKKVWANAILLEMSKTTVEDLIFEEGMVRDNHFYVTGFEGKSEEDDIDFNIDHKTKSFKIGMKDLKTSF
jgi:hypothetical protein